MFDYTNYVSRGNETMWRLPEWISVGILTLLVGLFTLGCDPMNKLANLVTGEGDCERAVGHLDECCRDTASASYPAACSAFNAGVSEALLNSLIMVCEEAGAEFIGEDGARLSASDAAGLDCESFLSRLEEIYGSSDGDTDGDEDGDTDEFEIPEQETDEDVDGDKPACNEGQGCDDNDPCTENDMCEDGLCEGSPLDCSSFEDLCNDAACVNGACVKTPINDGASCGEGPDACVPLVCQQGDCVQEPLADDSLCNDEDPCTQDDHCVESVCTGTPKICADTNACTADSCDSTTGDCVFDPVAMNSESCNDNDACTVNDVCAAGICAGAAKDCSGLDDACNEGVCGDGGICEKSPTNQGGNCNDGNLCTENDSCDSGICAGTAKVCADSEFCTSDYCNEATGLCVFNGDLMENTGCNDNDACTVGDRCTGGSCVPTGPKDCSAFDDDCNEGVCNEGTCSASPINEAGECNDNNKCTLNDTCEQGVCGGDAKNCDDGKFCTSDSCEPSSGNCLNNPFPMQGEDCDDEDDCTVGDRCVSGACLPTGPRDCSAFADACNDGVCEEGSCSAQPKEDLTPCNDKDSCTVGDRCVSGDCLPTGPLDCSAFDDTCNEGVCSGGVCSASPINEEGDCDDEDDCTVGDRCVSGDCLPTGPLDCSAFDDACNEGVCSGGTCSASPINEEGGCDDEDDCTVGDRCVSGDCLPTGPLDCSAFDDACNEGVCSGGVCSASPINEAGECDDDDDCTIGDRCVSGDCLPTGPLDCSAFDDTCNEGVCSGGVCSASPINEAGECDDDDDCTIGDRCVSGDCLPTGPLDCSAFDDACNEGVCSGGVCSASPINEDGECNDDDDCTIGDRCVSGDCLPTGPLDCSAFDDACNEGVCSGGVCSASPINEDGECNDDDDCTIGDRCVSGDCLGDAVDCSAFSNQCNDGICVDNLGAPQCVADPLPEGTPCDDTDPGTFNDACDETGLCAGDTLPQSTDPTSGRLALTLPVEAGPLVDTVCIHVTLSGADLSSAGVEFTSAEGTLLDPPLADHPAAVSPLDIELESTQFAGEERAGDWVLEVQVDDPGVPATVDVFTLDFAACPVIDGDMDDELELEDELEDELELEDEIEAEPETDGDAEVETETGPFFVPIEAGSFWMGSPSGCPGPDGYPGDCTAELGRESDETLHYVELTYDFELMTTEVTQGQWRAVAQAEGWGEDPSYYSACGDDCPVELVSWFEVLEYANALSRNAGLTECYVLSGCTGTIGSGCGGNYYCYDGYSCTTVSLNGVTKPQDCEGYRLPTEAEWEYSIRAGTTTAFYNGGITQQYRDPLDPNLDEIGWYGGNSGVDYSGGWNCSGWYPGSTTCGTHPVASKAPNAWGLYDMSGNLWEWTWDWYQSAYQNDLDTDPIGPSTGSYRVDRGGSWGHYAWYCRSAGRLYYSPGARSNRVGARLCRSISGGTPDGDMDEELELDDELELEIEQEEEIDGDADEEFELEDELEDDLDIEWENDLDTDGDAELEDTEFIYATGFCDTNLCWPVLPTNQDGCFSTSSSITCPDTAGSETCGTTDYCGQDAQYSHNSRTFDCYDALGALQDPCDETADVDEVVVDTFTGLMWQRQLPTLYDGCTGGTTSGTYCKWQEALDYCDGLDYGGYQDWRLPAPHELYSLMDAATRGVAIDLDVFVGTPMTLFWTSAPYAGSSSNAWYVNFSRGIVDYTSKTYTSKARCVRGGPAESDAPASERWVVSGEVDEEIVTDRLTGLIWQKTIPASRYWTEALAYCESLTYAGRSDWRLPTAHELQSLVDYGLDHPASTLPGMASSTVFWSSTTSVDYADTAYYMRVSSGGLGDTYDKTINQYWPRCVTGGP